MLRLSSVVHMHVVVEHVRCSSHYGTVISCCVEFWYLALVRMQGSCVFVCPEGVCYLAYCVVVPGYVEPFYVGFGTS